MYIRNLKIYLSHLIIVLIFYSCEMVTYEPFGENKSNLTLPEFPNFLQINLTDTNDTLNLWGPVDINYNYYVKNLSGSRVLLFVDNNFITSTINDSTIRFNSEVFSDGLHKLELVLQVPTNSGSLADKFLGEYFTKKVEKSIYIDNSIPDTGMSINPLKIDGSIKLQWNAYKKINFQEYLIYKVTKSRTGEYKDLLLSRVFNHDSSYVYDHTYLGDSIFYRIDLKAKNNTIRGNNVLIYFSKPDFINVQVVNNNSAEIKWNKCDFENNFDKYEIYLEDNSMPQSNLIYSTNEISDTFYNDSNLGFGNSTRYSIVTHSKNIQGIKDSVQGLSQPIYIGNEFIGFYLFNYHAPSNSLLISNNFTYKVNFSDLSISAQLEGLVRLNIDGTKACRLLSGMVDEINPNDFSVIKPLNLFTLFNSSDPILQSNFFFLSQPDQIITNNFLSNQFNYTETNPAIIDITNLSLINQPYNNSYRITEVSNNGKYLLLIFPNGQYNIAIYKFENNNTILKYNLPSSQESSFCFVGDGDYFIFTNNNTISYRKTEDNSVIKEINIGTFLYNPSYDPITNRIGGMVWGNPSKYKIYDMATHQLYKEVNVLSSLWNRIHLFNNTLFSPTGYYLKLN